LCLCLCPGGIPQWSRLDGQSDIVNTGIRTGPIRWDIAPDGRFLIITETSTDASITLVLNWRAAQSN
jgi:hypothetical protein